MAGKLTEMEKVFKALSVNMNNEKYFIGKVVEIDYSDRQVKINAPDGSSLCLIPENQSSPKKNYAVIDKFTFPLIQIGDVIEVNESKRIEIHFSRERNDNALFITENCNCNCLSCPQPPVKKNDSAYFFNINRIIIESLDQNCRLLGITGGEPLIAGEYLFRTLQLINERLSNTEVQILTNGILLGNKEFFTNLSQFITSRYFWGIPLYSDFPNDHDSMVGHKGGFYYMINGLYNMAETEAKIEIRILLNSLTIKRIRELSKFIFRNLPFVSHVAFMGLENIGNATKNWNLLEMNYSRFSEELEESINFLSCWNIPVSIYNVPLCHLPHRLHQYSTVSISDWKRIYLSGCEHCLLRTNCGGLFKTSNKSYQIMPFPDIR